MFYILSQERELGIHLNFMQISKEREHNMYIYSILFNITRTRTWYTTNFMQISWKRELVI